TGLRLVGARAHDVRLRARGRADTDGPPGGGAGGRHPPAARRWPREVRGAVLPAAQRGPAGTGTAGRTSRDGRGQRSPAAAAAGGPLRRRVERPTGQSGPTARADSPPGRPGGRGGPAAWRRPAHAERARLLWAHVGGVGSARPRVAALLAAGRPVARRRAG